MGKKLSTFVWLYWGIVSLILIFTLGYETLSFVRNIPPLTPASTVVFIKPGSSVREMSRTLAEAQVLKTPWKLSFLARIFRKQAALRPGEYKMDVPSPPWTILRTLIEGKVILHKVTFPEGFTMTDITETLAASSLVNPDEFRGELARKDLLARLNLPGDTFEGFLFPDTYYFAKTDPPAKIVEAMVSRFRQAIRPEDQEKAEGFGFTLLQWITMASMIERESSLPDEHVTISSVFHNRLKKKMRLQSDPTVIYGIPNFNGNLTKLDLETPTPYNTYTRGGLPPGPIANPGESAIHAAVNPASTEYLYFVADQEGRHIFSKTYEEHLKAVAIYQLHRAAPPQAK
jgi:UPF0755 protein